MAIVFCIVLGCVAIFFAWEWFVQRIGAATLIWYLQEKGYPLPSGEEMKRGSKWVVNHFLSEKFGQKR